MNKLLRRTAVLCGVQVVPLLARATWLQFVQGDALADDPRIRRVQMAAFAKPRGDIIVGGTPITASREIPGSDSAYQRVYRDLPMYDPVTGYLQAQGATFLEGVHGDLLIGEAVRLTSNPLDELTGRKPRGGDVVTAIDPISRSEIAAADWAPPSPSPSSRPYWAADSYASPLRQDSIPVLPGPWPRKDEQ